MQAALSSRREMQPTVSKPRLAPLCANTCTCAVCDGGGAFRNGSWFEQYRRLAKLNLQAHQSAMARSDEYVLESLLTFDKLGVVVHELLAIEAWKEVRSYVTYTILVFDAR